jgi:hypothetical protein
MKLAWPPSQGVPRTPHPGGHQRPQRLYVRPAMMPAGSPDLALAATLLAAAHSQKVRDKGNLPVGIAKPACNTISGVSA